MDQVQTIVVDLQRREIKMRCYVVLRKKGNEYHLDLAYAAAVKGQGKTEVYELEKPIEKFKSPEEAFETFLIKMKREEWDLAKKSEGETLLGYKKQVEIVKKVFPDFS